MGKVRINGNIIASEDMKYFKEVPDAGFSEEHNRKVINESIRKYEAQRRQRAKEYAAHLGERSEVVASFLKAKDQRGISGGIENYVSRNYLGELQGQKIMMEVLDKRNKHYKLGERDS